MASGAGLVSLAKMANKAERYDDMAQAMNDFVRQGNTLTVEERDLLVAAYTQAHGERRSAWRGICVIEKKKEGSEEAQAMAVKYRMKLEIELVDICTEVLHLLSTYLVPNIPEPPPHTEGDADDTKGDTPDTEGDAHATEGNAGDTEGDADNMQGNAEDTKLEGNTGDIEGNADVTEGDANAEDTEGNADDTEGDVDATEGENHDTELKGNVDDTECDAADNEDDAKDKDWAVTKVFYLKMKGDYYRYLAEVKTGQDKTEAEENSRNAYHEAFETAKAHLHPSNPTRLGLALSLSQFYYDFDNNKAEANTVALEESDLCKEQLGAELTRPEHTKSYEAVMLIMKQLIEWGFYTVVRGKGGK